MPPDVSPAIALSDVLTIVGMVVALFIQGLVALRWINKRLEDRDDALRRSVDERNRELAHIVGKLDTVREHTRAEIARVDRDMAGLRERMAVMPSRKDLDDVIRDRVAPVETVLRALEMQLIRIGVCTPRDTDIQRGRAKWPD